MSVGERVPGLRGLGRRVGWTLADQCLSSGTNFALGVLVARSVSPEKFGVFSVCYVTYLLFIGFSRALTAQPLVMRYSAADPEDARLATRRSLGAAFDLGLVVAVGSALVAMAFGGLLRPSFLALALVIPGLLVQDTIRYAFFALGRPQGALWNDLIWGIAQLLTVALLLLLSKANVAALLIAWGCSGWLAAAFGLVGLGMRPDVVEAGSWLREHLDLSGRLSAEFMLISGASQVTLYTLGLVTGLAEVASLRAAQILIGPLNVLITATRISLVAEGVRLHADGTSLLRRGAATMSSAMGLSAVAWSGVMFALPQVAGEALLGQNWDAARPLLPLLGFAVAFRGVAAGAAAGLRSLGEVSDILKTRALIAPVTVLAGAAGAAWFGAGGAAVALMITGLLTASLYWRQFLHAVTTVDKVAH